MSEFDRFANGAKTFLSYPLDSSGTSISVNSLVGFPSPPFKVVINSEIIKVKSIDTTNKAFSLVSRGEEGTTPVQHYVGAQIVNVLTRNSLLSLSVDNNIANFALSSSTFDPYASYAGSRIYLVPKEGDRISLIDPIENIWRIFYIDSENPSFLDVSQIQEDLNKLVDVFAYYDDSDQKVKVYQFNKWSMNNPSERTSTTRINGILVKSDNYSYRYLNTYQIKKYQNLQIACFGLKTLNLSTDGNLALYHNNFLKITINQTGKPNYLYAIEKGYDGQRLILINDSESTLLYISKIALSIPDGFATISIPGNQILEIGINAGIELYYDACFEKWNVIENKTTS